MSHTLNIYEPLSIEAIRAEFPILQTTVYGYPLVYLDNAASTQKPSVVLEALDEYYKTINANVHRGVHHLSQLATDAFEEARRKVAAFINAAHDYEIIFTRGTTNGINTISSTFGRAFLKPGDEVLISAMEHHSNIVPWQMACEYYGAKLKVIPMTDRGELELDEYSRLLNSGRVKIVAVTYVSNSLGTVNPVRDMIRQAHAAGIPVLVDAAQAVQHILIDVQDLDADFLVFSSHKIYGPTGIGVLYGKEAWLNKLPPHEGGGEMIKTVSFGKTTYNDLPFKFEAGTPDMSGAIGLKAALDYVDSIGIDRIQLAEEALLTYALDALSTVPGIRFVGEAEHRAGAISFLLGKHHPFDVGELLDKQGIAVRTGHHCCQPVMDRLDIPGTVRASFSVYNTPSDVDRLVAALVKSGRMLG
ncbi:aminotransferase class V-fold PLP-dependent enzyme [Dinghuibacter silviterrae]|uniref:cysteine desulfurase n=1 Tax=Dinghuibacter silviterrae TaxID=1539049 RepID=A0A4R8DUV7_9BACT|nr:cysteine desulfurase [Dinghuibacter silviterrae]TDX01245.1 cysteine desulfurase/selenocysteine lyase [Dinghuibacter silviterrae]